MKTTVLKTLLKTFVRMGFCIGLACSCAHNSAQKSGAEINRLQFNDFKKAKVDGPVELRLKATMGQIENLTVLLSPRFLKINH
jgi:hypothetical protein